MTALAGDAIMKPDPPSGALSAAPRHSRQQMNIQFIVYNILYTISELSGSTDHLISNVTQTQGGASSAQRAPESGSALIFLACRPPTVTRAMVSC